MIGTKSVLNLTDSSFDQAVAKGVSLVDFWAEWCMPCRMQAPIIERIARTMGESVAVCKLNVDDHPQTAARFRVSGIPTLIFFKDGAEAARLVGVQSESSIMRVLQTLLQEKA